MVSLHGFRNVTCNPVWHVCLPVHVLSSAASRWFPPFSFSNTSHDCPWTDSRSSCLFLNAGSWRRNSEMNGKVKQRQHISRGWIINKCRRMMLLYGNIDISFNQWFRAVCKELSGLIHQWWGSGTCVRLLIYISTMLSDIFYFVLLILTI